MSTTLNSEGSGYLSFNVDDSAIAAKVELASCTHLVCRSEGSVDSSDFTLRVTNLPFTLLVLRPTLDVSLERLSDPN